MFNIWGFLLQTITVSIMAAMILAAKKIFEDKLSPKWQYGIWSIFAIRVLLPVQVGTYEILPLPLYMEYLKTMIEGMLHSSYSGEFIPIRLEHVFPILSKAPSSITDYLFVIYIIGVLAALFYFALFYLRLRFYVKKRVKRISREMENELKIACNEYFIKPCQTIAVEGLQTAFICGVIHPVLVVPAEFVIDKKIYLHELLHKKYHDVIQNIFWCFLRCLHWCNPFLHYVFDRIENDMETLCDQRVLEILKGEERREYGVLLLGMANEKYSRTPGTSSISNGGDFIKKRIEAIVRFKKYPKGMALVSVCILIVLAAFFVRGNSYEMSGNHSDYQAFSEDELNLKLAKTRMIRCSTPFGAIDTYAKGLLYENGLYIAMASPISKQESIRQEILDYGGYWMYPSGISPEEINLDWGYRIYNLLPDSKGRYDGWLTFYTSEQNFWSETYRSNMFLIPIQVWEEDGSWVVKETGERSHYKGQEDDKADFPSCDSVFAYGDYGKITIHANHMYLVNQPMSGSGGLGFAAWGDNFDSAPVPDAEAKYVTESLVTYEYAEKRTEEDASSHVGMMCYVPERLQNPEILESTIMTGNSGGGSNDGVHYTNMLLSNENWDGILISDDYYEKNVKAIQKIEEPLEYRVRIYWDGHMKEELIIKPYRPMQYLNY